MELTLGIRFRIINIEESVYHAPFETSVSKIKNLFTQPRGSKDEVGCNRKELAPLWVELWVEKLQTSPRWVSKIENIARAVADQET
jgi:hypothetical protein